MKNMKNIKKLTSLILVIILIIGVIPLSVLTASAETVKMGYIFETGVNIRSDATTASDIVDNVSNLNVNVLGSKGDTKNNINPSTNKAYIWYKISYTSGSETITGYVREDLINVTEYTISDDFNEALKAFPKSYRESLKKLHAIYPNWQFIADKVPLSFDDSVNLQDFEDRKLLTGSSQNSWRSMRKGTYNWETGKYITYDGGRYGASREVIAYYMDPRNFLNANDIYVFMTQTYDSKTQTKAAVEALIENTFLDATITDKNDEYKGKRYSAVIRKAAKEADVNAFVLASTIIQEHGNSGTTLSNGTAKYNNKVVYNFFNFGASGTTKDEVLTNGKKRAYNEGWFTPSESIIGGAKKYSSGYLTEGQNTYYYKNYNVLNPNRIWHQYAQNVADSVNSASRLKKNYSTLYDMKLTFRIPVFDGLPSTASKLPAKSDKLNNYYFESLKSDGLSPAYDRYTDSYTLNADGNKTVSYKLPTGAVYSGESSYPLIAGQNVIKLKIKSQSGYTRTYKITVNASKTATLFVQQGGGTLKKEDDGNWHYYIDDQKVSATTLVKFEGKWYYVKDGVLDRTATKLFKYLDKWYYIKDGVLNSSYTGLLKYNEKHYYIKKGEWLNGYTGLVKYNNKNYYVKKGVLKRFTGFITHTGNKYYVKNGVKLNKTGVITYKNNRYYIINGKRSTKEYTLYKRNGKYLAFKSGKWYKGKKIIKYSGKKYYVNKGYAKTGYTGRVWIGSKSYWIKKGKVV